MLMVDSHIRSILFFFFFLSSVGSQIAEVAQECVSDISGEGRLRLGHGTLSYYCNLSVELGYGILGGGYYTRKATFCFAPSLGVYLSFHYFVTPRCVLYYFLFDPLCPMFL